MAQPPSSDHASDVIWTKKWPVIRTQCVQKKGIPVPQTGFPYCIPIVIQVRVSPPMCWLMPGLGNTFPWSNMVCAAVPNAYAAVAGKCILPLGRKYNRSLVDKSLSFINMNKKGLRGREGTACQEHGERR